MASRSARLIKRGRGAGLRAGADVPGALLITGAMMPGVFTIVDPAAQQGWLAARTLGPGACSLVLLGGFIRRQRTARNPLMPLRIFSAQHHPAAAALTDGYHLALWIACGLVVAAAGIAAAMLRPQPTRPPSPQPAPELAAAGQAD